MRFPAFCITFFIFQAVTAQHVPDSIKGNKIYSAALGAHYGFIFAHVEEVKNTRGSLPWGIELDINMRLMNNPAWNECNCYPRSGLNISFFDFDNPVLGNGINASWYIEPFLSVNHRLNFSMKGAAGISYLTNPYHKEKNPENQSYSTYLSAYLAAGLGINFSVAKHFSGKVSAYYNHSSNGAVKEPNKGINWPAGTIHVYYVFNPVSFPPKQKKELQPYFKKPLRKEIYFLATQRTLLSNEDIHYFIFGAGANFSKQISGMNALNAGAEIVFDYAFRTRLRNAGENQDKFIQPSVLAGHEFLMGRFNFSQQLGFYVVNRGPFYDAVYQRYGITYSFTNKIAAGINMKVHRHIANFLDGRIIVGF